MDNNETLQKFKESLKQIFDKDNVNNAASYAYISIIHKLKYNYVEEHNMAEFIPSTMIYRQQIIDNRNNYLIFNMLEDQLEIINIDNADNNFSQQFNLLSDNVSIDFLSKLSKGKTFRRRRIFRCK